MRRAKFRHHLFRYVLGYLPRCDLFDGLSLRIFEDALLLEEFINAGTHMFFAHHIARLTDRSCASLLCIMRE